MEHAHLPVQRLADLPVAVHGDDHQGEDGADGAESVDKSVEEKERLVM